MKYLYQKNGFTLIELMIVVAIIAILAAIALPAYNTHITKTHRASVKACMSELAQVMERRFTTALTYSGDEPSLGCQTESDLDNRYSIQTAIPSSRAYTITATPIGAQLSDTQCGTLTLDQTGATTASGTEPTKCW